MKYTHNAMKFGTQSRSSFVNHKYDIWNWVSWPELKNLGRFGLKIAMCSNFYEIWHSVQIKHANYEYSTWNWRS